MMTRKHYRMLAECFHQSVEEEHNRAEDIFTAARLGALARAQVLISEVLKKDNPRFDGYRFLQACIRGVK